MTNDTKHVICARCQAENTPGDPNCFACGCVFADADLDAASRVESAEQAPPDDSRSAARPVRDLMGEARATAALIRKTFWVILLVALAWLWYSSLWGDVIRTDSGINIGRLSMVERSGLPCIEGTARNKSGRKYHEVSITFRLLDASGRVVGTAGDKTLDLEEGARWKFSARATTSNFEQMKFDGVTAK
ncbi:MAG: FxLYD domain-containing protein [Armatimonadetes bacterium]|nr:FxLYD domain-containing protein [Armatimonadota bacterium]